MLNEIVIVSTKVCLIECEWLIFACTCGTGIVSIFVDERISKIYSPMYVDINELTKKARNQESD